MSDPATPPEDRTSFDGASSDGASSAGGAPQAGQAPGDSGHAGPSTKGGQTSALLSKAVVGLARVVFRRGRKRARGAAISGRVLLDLRQLRHDRDVMYQKLGREVRRLVEGGEVDHPGLARDVERIEALETRIDAAEAQQAARRSTEFASTSQPEPDADPAGTPAPGRSGRPMPGEGS